MSTSSMRMAFIRPANAFPQILGAVIDEHGYDRLSTPGERSTMRGTCRVCIVSEQGMIGPMAFTEASCYAWAGLNLGVVEAPPIIEGAMQRMFGLSRVEASPGQWHATVRMTLDEDGEFIDSMPPLVRGCYASVPPTQVPRVVRHNGDEYAIVARSEAAGAYVVCTPPYKDCLLYTSPSPRRPY